MRRLAAELGPEDGTDPRLVPREELRVTNRKALQLCGQVERALHGVLASLADDVIRELLVVSVEPAPNAGRLLVTLARSPAADPAVGPDAVEARLSGAIGLLRSEVARAVVRRRAPELAFRLVTG
jgi:ribosome-binding factor A